MSRISLKKYRVSIHALLAECDRPCQDVIHLPGCFNPRTPCGVRPRYFMDSVKIGLFQSTHSLRSATAAPKKGKKEKTFQSTHSLRSATNGQWRHQGDRPVSIHALLAECDGTTRKNRTSSKRFNPRTPCGVRPFDCAVFRGAEQRFQSTHSLRSATAVVGMKKS